jgi:glycosyltransferase involved in cell wall biosynthesis
MATERPLRIVFDARNLLDFGIGTYIRNLIAGLAEIDPANQYTLLVEQEGRDAFASLPGNFRTTSYTGSRHRVIQAFAFPRFLRSLGADLYHLPMNVAPVFMPKPYVVTIHDMSRLLFAEHHTDMRDELTLRWFSRSLLRADKVISVSHATERDVMSTLGIPQSRIRMIYNAPDPVFSSQLKGQDLEDSSRVMERYQINYPFLLYAGNVRPQKNVPRLVEAFAVLRGELAGHPQYGDLRLIIIGDEISNQVRQMVIRSRVEQSVRFLGFVPINTLRIFYKSAAAFVFPSLYEGFGLPPLEAMACGTPVVASNVSSLPEVVGDAAVIVNPENVFDIARGIREVLLDNELRLRCVLRGIQQVRRFSWKRTAGQVLEVYREVAAGDRTGPRGGASSVAG